MSPTSSSPLPARGLEARGDHTASARPPDGRDPWFDNAKLVLVTLVVIGHSLVMLPESATKQHLYDFVYAWHMPAFVLVTGALSRNFSYSPARLWSLFRGVAVPYVIMEAAMVGYRVMVGGEQLHQVWVETHWPMWFLPALFCWRLATPVLRWLGRWAVPVAVVTCLAGGYLGFDYLAVQRTLGFLPFFVVGLLLTPGVVETVRSAPGRVVGAGVLLGVWALSGRTDDWAQTAWFYYDWPYDTLTASEYPAVVTRAVVLLVGLAGAFAVLSLVPRRRHWYTTMGAASLVVYLCHGFVIKTVEYTGYPDWAAENHQLALIINVLGATVLALLLASPWLAPRLQRLVDPLSYAERELQRAIAVHARAEMMAAGPAMAPVTTEVTSTALVESHRSSVDAGVR